jgi:hypothetical protein
VSKPRNAPIVDIDNPQQERLGQFPSQAVIDKGTEVTTVVQQESQKMYELAVKMNQHELLVPDSLPAPSQPAAYAFRDQYKAAMESLPHRILKSTMPPTAEDVKKARDKLWEEKFKDQIRIYNGKAINLDELKKDFEEEAASIPKTLNSQAAERHLVYMDMGDSKTGGGGALTINSKIQGTSAPPPQEIWNAQLMLWLQEDVANAIASANETAIEKAKAAGKPSGIMAAPVKRILRLGIKPGIVAPGNAAANSQLPRSLAASPTGRVSNGLFDVMHFELSLHCDIAQIPYVLQELSRSRLITITNLNLTPIDVTVEEVNGFMYGDQPVATIDMTCEALFLRKWTEPLMPEVVKRQLGITQVQQAPAEE